MRELLLIRYGEIALKGKNIKVFENKLYSNIKKAIAHVEEARVTNQHGRVYVEYETDQKDDIIEAVTRVFGIVSVSPAIRVENDLAAIQEEALKEIQRLKSIHPFKTFKVEAKRANKGFPLTSPEVAKHVGGFINTQMEDLSVDVHHPEMVLYVEVRNQTYLFSEKIKALGGMPYGTCGKGLLLLSGGIDSPVAGYMMARRGVELEAIHFHSYPFTSERAMQKVEELAQKVSRYTGRIRIHHINLLEIQKAINEHCPSEEMTILSRCFMMQIAEKIAENRQCHCLITGENIGQVASQTMQGLTVTNSSVDIPVLRPLIAYDKQEIIEVAKVIDTFETSIQPFEDCCTVFLPDKVVTKPRVEKIKESQSLLDSENLMKEAIEQMTVTMAYADRIEK